MVLVTALLALASMLVGEGPLWIESDQSLMVIDILGGYKYRYYTQEQRVQRIKADNGDLGSDSTFIVPLAAADNEFLMSVHKSLTLVQISSDDASHITKAASEYLTVEGNDGQQFNDAKCDSQGRLWAGIMVKDDDGVNLPGAGILYKLESDLSLAVMYTNLTTPNGLAWNSNRTEFYYNDSPTRRVLVFDYEESAGTISNPRVLIDFDANQIEGNPDGMTIDTDDNLWIACYGGSQIVNVDTRTGELIRTVPIPSTYVTSAIFGGANYSTLYVTTAAAGLSKEEEDLLPYSGYVFEVTDLGVQGLPSFNCILP